MTSCAFKPLSFNNSVSTNFNYAVLFIVHQKVLGCYKWPEFKNLISSTVSAFPIAMVDKYL